MMGLMEPAGAHIVLGLAMAAGQVEEDTPPREAPTGPATYIRKSRATHSNQQKAIMQRCTLELIEVPEGASRGHTCPSERAVPLAPPCAQTMSSTSCRMPTSAPPSPRPQACLCDRCRSGSRTVDSGKRRPRGCPATRRGCRRRHMATAWPWWRPSRARTSRPPPWPPRNRHPIRHHRLARSRVPRLCSR